ncbi:Procollagen galactosyltransferase 1 [Elsinoe australis]|uniref:Procollagen galactosyltransferase 1 n=1 Tax=Elsinoe australis TaxID=40998 RepID=A0A2P7YVM5_9PEZI|nr:Procollagen galactosyltransferase 1 [Elsinoe australis]
MLRLNIRGAVLLTVVVVVLILSILHLQWAEQSPFNNLRLPDKLDFRRPEVLEPDIADSESSAANATLGFQSILALSQGTKWRVDGLRAAGQASGITVTIPPQPKWSEPFIKAFEEFGPVEAHGAAMAWLGHIDLLKFVILNGWGSALILEDDMDWDVDVRKQTPSIANAVVKLTGGRRTDRAPYGLEWDVMWLGHCSDPPPNEKGTIVWFKDNTTIPLEKYRGLNPHIKEVAKEGQRGVHHSINPVCTFAYAVSAVGARKTLAHASLGHGGAFDLMLMHACQDKVLDCVSVNPEIFNPYHTAEGDTSEVRAGDNNAEFNADAGKSKGWTDNILQSARCAGLFHETCLQ